MIAAAHTQYHASVTRSSSRSAACGYPCAVNFHRIEGAGQVSSWCESSVPASSSDVDVNVIVAHRDALVGGETIEDTRTQTRYRLDPDYDGVLPTRPTVLMLS